MGYTNLGKVKVALHLDLAETEFDGELSQLIEAKSQLIDLRLRRYTDTPLTPTPKVVESICVELVRLEYRKRRAPDHDALNVLNRMIKEALEWLDEYITVHFEDEHLGIVVTERRVDYQRVEDDLEYGY